MVWPVQGPELTYYHLSFWLGHVAKHCELTAVLRSTLCLHIMHWPFRPWGWLPGTRIRYRISGYLVAQVLAHSVQRSLALKEPALP